MARYRASIRVRLAIGLGLVLAVFSAALLVTLHYLAELKQMSDEVTARMEVRRQVVATVRAAEQLQSGFPAAEAADPANLANFDRVYDLLQQRITTLLSERTDQPEGAYLAELRRASADLRALLERQTASAAGKPAAVSAEEMDRESREILDRMEMLNQNLVDIFDSRVISSAMQAQTAWNYSSAISQVIFPVALLVSLLIIYYTHRSVSGPVGALVTGTRTLAEGELRSDIQVDGSGEFR